MSIPTPKGFIVNAIYEPDRERMLKALRIVLESTGNSEKASAAQEGAQQDSSAREAS